MPGLLEWKPDLLADLVFKGEKTATASAYDLYALEDEPPSARRHL